MKTTATTPAPILRIRSSSSRRLDSVKPGIFHDSLLSLSRFASLVALLLFGACSPEEENRCVLASPASYVCPTSTDGTILGEPSSCSVDSYQFPATGTMTWTNNTQNVFGGFHVGVSFELDGQAIRVLACSPPPEDSPCWLCFEHCRCWNVGSAWQIPGPISEPWWMDWSTFVGPQNAIGSATKFRNHRDETEVDLILTEDAHQIDSEVLWYQPEQGEFRAWAERDDGYWRLDLDLHWDP
jgi:hypothetical protein